MTTTAEPIEPHHVHSDRLMQHAFEQLAKGDRLQASEKAWGAMAHTLKQIAAERSLKYEEHRNARQIMLAVARNSPHNRAIRAGYAEANELHKNFYNDRQYRDDLEEALETVSDAITLLQQEQAKWRQERSPLSNA